MRDQPRTPTCVLIVVSVIVVAVSTTNHCTKPPEPVENLTVADATNGDDPSTTASEERSAPGVSEPVGVERPWHLQRDSASARGVGVRRTLIDTRTDIALSLPTGLVPLPPAVARLRFGPHDVCLAAPDPLIVLCSLVLDSAAPPNTATLVDQLAASGVLSAGVDRQPKRVRLTPDAERTAAVRCVVSRLGRCTQTLDCDLVQLDYPTGKTWLLTLFFEPEADTNPDLFANLRDILVQILQWP